MTQLAFDREAARFGLSPVAAILRVEGGATFGLAVAAYAYLGFSWWLFAALILAPDLAMLGYLRGPRVGAWTYNLGHTYIMPLALGTIGFLAGQPLLISLAAIWVAHIGVDRLVGYGLKFPGNFKDNHLSRLAAKGV